MASKPPKINEKDAAMAAASVAFPEVDAALAVKDAMDSNKQKEEPTPRSGGSGTNSHTTVSKENGDVHVNVYGNDGTGGGSDTNNSKKEKKYINIDELAGQQSIIFWVAIFIHLIDVFIIKFVRTGGALTIITLIYGFMIIFIAMRYKGDGSHKKIIYTSIILAIVLPKILDLDFITKSIAGSRFTLATGALLLCIPIVPILSGMAFKENEKISKIVGWYIIIWMLIGFVVIMANYGTFSTQQSKVIIKPMESLKFLFNSIGKSFESIGKTFSDTIKKTLAQATGQPYEGEEENRAGVYVEEVRPIESKYSTNTPVYVEAKIKSINVKDKVNVNTICYIEGVTQGTANPTMLYDVYGNYDNVVSCNMGVLKEGVHTVKVRANFEFETSSDIEYTFVSNQLRPDQYESLNIEPNVVATYSGGPVAVGLTTLTQPLRINVENTQLSNYQFGVSLENKWPQGKVVKGIRYVLNVPTEVTLIDCSRDPIIRNEPDPELQRNTYIFEMNTTNTQDTFDGVRCRMYFNNANGLLGTNLKSVRTFAARARYEYAVEGSTTIIVENS